LLRCVWIVRCLRARFTVDGAKQRSLTIAIAIDPMGRIRRMTGISLVDRVHRVEVVGRIVDVDGNTRKLRRALFIGIRQRQKRRGRKHECKATASRWHQ